MQQSDDKQNIKVLETSAMLSHTGAWGKRKNMLHWL